MSWPGRAVLSAAALLLVACGGRASAPERGAPDAAVAAADGGTSSCPNALMPAPGARDAHCLTDAEKPIRQRVFACVTALGAEAGVPEGAVLLNGEGHDDDCKYQLALRAECAGEVPRFVLTLRDGRGPVTGAQLRAQLVAVDGAESTADSVEEEASGTYRLGFPALPTGAGAVLHVHLFERCAYVDESSPRAHAAFLLGS